MDRWIIAALVCALPLTAHAQRPRRAAPEVQAAIAQLASNDRMELRGAIEQLGLLGDPAGVTPIVERVRRGLPQDVLDAALDALTVLGRPEAGPLFIELLSHRRPAVRLKAVAGIVGCRPRGGDRALADALADSDALVRSAAAQGLGAIGATSAMDALFNAFDRRIDGAGPAIARLARPEDVERFLGYVGQLPFDVLTPALQEMLLRDELAERARLSIVHRLSELATPEVRNILSSYLAALPEGEGGQVRRAAEDAVRRISQ
jgi:HEAT repeat protein